MLVLERSGSTNQLVKELIQESDFERNDYNNSLTAMAIVDPQKYALTRTEMLANSYKTTAEDLEKYVESFKKDGSQIPMKLIRLLAAKRMVGDTKLKQMMVDVMRPLGTLEATKIVNAYLANPSSGIRGARGARSGDGSAPIALDRKHPVAGAGAATAAAAATGAPGAGAAAVTGGPIGGGGGGGGGGAVNG